jgi:hypothetical protein
VCIITLFFPRDCGSRGQASALLLLLLPGCYLDNGDRNEPTVLQQHRLASVDVLWAV